jgi:hypothetical protein
MIAGAVPFKVKRYKVPTPAAAQKLTVKLVAQCIRDSSSYLPIRNLAAAIATRARPKDYFGQVKAIYDDFLTRWRYVKDTVGVETLAASPRAVFHLVIGGDGRGVGGGKGAGDCDDAACAIGGMLAAIGIPVRVVTARNPRLTRGLFSHIFVQAHVPGHGWISVDPVGHPAHGFAWTPPHSAIAVWNLKGTQIAGDQLFGDFGGEETQMYNSPGYGAFGSSDDYSWDERPIPATVGDPLPWDVYGLAGFGSFVDSMGYVGHGMGYMIEVDEDNRYGDSDYYRTPMLEMSPGPYELASRYGIVLDGTMALGDDGAVYEYDGMGGFFKKLFKKAKGVVKKIGKKVIGGAEKLLKKTKFGRAIINIKNKILKTALKLVKPLLKVVGKWAPRLAPIAAMIPGVGPVISGYLIAAGTAAKLADAHGVEFVEMLQTDKKTGKKKKVTKLSGKPKNILAYKKALEKASKKAKKLPKSKLKAGAEAMKRYKGKKLPRKPVWGGEAAAPGKVLKAGTAEYRGALKALGLRRGALRGMTKAQKKAALMAAKQAFMRAAGYPSGRATVARPGVRPMAAQPQFTQRTLRRPSPSFPMMRRVA